MKKIFQKINQGQVTIELIIAFSIIVLALVSIISLTIINLRAQKISEDHFIAAQLAREGIEVVRNIRDSGWLAGNITLKTATDDYKCHYSVVKFDRTDNNWSIDCKAVDDSAVGDDLPEITRLYVDDDYGIYSHVTSGSFTNFKRMITLDPICLDYEDGTVCTLGDYGICEYGEDCDSCCGVNRIAGFRVKSTVQWLDKSKPQFVVLMDYLFDWR